MIAAGTDPDSPVNKTMFGSRDFYSAIIARQTYLSPQYKVAVQFVKEIMDDPRYEVSQLSGYSQGSYMLKVELNTISLQPLLMLGLNMVDLHWKKKHLLKATLLCL